MSELKEYKNYTRFSSTLDTRYIGKDIKGKELWMITNPFKFYTEILDKKYWALVEENFISDGASRPDFLRWFLTRWGEHGQAAVVHDALCVKPIIYSDSDLSGYYITQAEVDLIFLEAMEVANVPFLKRYVIYGAVRIYQISKGFINSIKTILTT